MIGPDDERHGTNAGYVAGCRNDCCRKAHMVCTKRYRMSRRGLVSSLGSCRRIQALVVIGWPMAHLSRRLGRDRNYVRQILVRDVIHLSTKEAIADLYEELCMIAPLDPAGTTRSVHARARAIGRRNSWVPPLAWDDIDTDHEPRGHRTRHSDRDYDSAHIIDEATILRILAGETLPANKAERLETMRRWLAAGNSERSLCERMGWRDSRYTPKSQEGAA